MWINRELFDVVVADNKRQAEELLTERGHRAGAQAQVSELRGQKAKDDITIDWMRHQVNSLTKINAQLLAKAAGIFIPTPEIVPTRPGTMSELPNFDSMPSFEDVGDEQAHTLGIEHELDGTVIYKK